MSGKNVWFRHLHPLDSLTCELELMLDHLFLERRPAVGWEPACDVYETPEAVIVVVELPGLTREDVEITTSAGLLTVTGRRVPTDLPPGTIAHLHERRFGPFERTIRLPRAVDAERSSAKMEAGLLTIRLPLRRPTRVSIRADEEGKAPRGGRKPRAGT